MSARHYECVASGNIMGTARDDESQLSLFRRRIFSLEEEYSDTIHGETDLGIARAGARHRGMVLAGLNSLIQDVWKALQIGRCIMQDERRLVTPSISIVKDTRPAGIIGIVQQAQPALLKLRLDEFLLFANGHAARGQRKILDGEQDPVAIRYRDTHRIQLPVEKVRPVRRRVHPHLVDDLGAGTLANNFRNGAEARPRSGSALGQVRLAGKL